MTLSVLLKPFRIAWSWLRYQVRLIRVGARRGNPLYVGIGSTKLFLALISVLAVLPQKDDGQWSWRLWSFIVSPPNEIGDTLAGIAGALAFLWIIVTVMLQSKELSEQRKVLLGQQQEFQQQNANMRDQIYDNMFFHMLSSLGETIEAIDLHDKGGKRTTGRDCFRVYFNRLKDSYNKNKKEKNGPPKAFDELNEDFFSQVGHEFGHYFRFLYNFFRFLDQNESTQIYHQKILRAFLSDYELALIFYNCRTEDGLNFKRYIERYELFDNLPMGLLLSEDHVDFYEAKAYGRNRHYKSKGQQ